MVGNWPASSAVGEISGRLHPILAQGNVLVGAGAGMGMPAGESVFRRVALDFSSVGIQEARGFMADVRFALAQRGV